MFAAVGLPQKMDLEVRTLATRLRRISQIVFFIAFVALLLRTKLFVSLGAYSRPAIPVNLFFKVDPLAALVNLLAHQNGFIVGLARLPHILILPC